MIPDCPARCSLPLALWAAQEIDRQAIVHISDSRCLRPAVWPLRSDGHEPMLVQNLKDLEFQDVVHSRYPNPGSRKAKLAGVQSSPVDPDQGWALPSAAQ